MTPALPLAYAVRHIYSPNGAPPHPRGPAQLGQSAPPPPLTRARAAAAAARVPAPPRPSRPLTPPYPDGTVTFAPSVRVSSTSGNGRMISDASSIWTPSAPTSTSASSTITK